jgi:signal transduction histidine kinase
MRTALKSLALTMGDSAAARVEIDVDPAAAAELTSDQATHLLNIAKEAMSNSIRHGRAAHVWVQVQRQDGRISLRVRDDGAGFDRAAADGKGLGLRNMVARSNEIAGDLRVHSTPDNGTEILLLLPEKEIK